MGILLQEYPSSEVIFRSLLFGEESPGFDGHLEDFRPTDVELDDFKAKIVGASLSHITQPHNFLWVRKRVKGWDLQQKVLSWHA